MAVDLSATITAIDNAITLLNTQLTSGDLPTGVQSISVAGRSISYQNLTEGIIKLTQWRLQLEELNMRLTGNKTMFARGNVTGLGT